MRADQSFQITNVNVFDSVAGRIDGPFDVTVARSDDRHHRPGRAN